MKKKIAALALCLILMVSMCPSFALAGGTLKIQLGGASAKAGESVDVPVILSNNPGIAGMQIKVIFGSDLTLTGIDYTDSASTGLTSQPSAKMTSPHKLTWYSGTSNSTFNGTIAVLHFTVSANCTAESLFVSLSVENDDVADIYEENVPFSTENGTVTILAAHNLSHVAAKDATTEADGNIEYWVCTGCGKYFSDAEAKNEITLEQTIIPKLTPTEPDPDAMQITVSGGQVILNNEIQVKVDISNNPGFAAIMGNVVYDSSKLTLVSATAGISEGNWLDLDDITESNSFMWFTMGDEYEGNGTILTLTFKAKENAALGDTSVTIEFDEFGGVSDAGENAIPCVINAGKITISNRIPGDINGDKKVNINDVIRIAQYVKAKGIGVEIVPGSADTNGDGKININDVIRTAQYVKAKGVGVVIY